jgi:hypothetical protein
VRAQPLLVVWEVLGHLELLISAGLARETGDDGERRFALTARADTGRTRAGIH